jgi:hypothetical protein
MTWEEVRRWLLLQCQIIQSEAQAVVIAHDLEPHPQRVRVELVHAFDEPWLLLLSPIVEEHRARPRDALVFNMRLAVGTLAVEQGYLMLRATCPLAALDATRLKRYVVFLATEAARLRHLHGRLDGPSPGDLFRD